MFDTTEEIEFENTIEARPHLRAVKRKVIIISNCRLVQDWKYTRIMISHWWKAVRLYNM